MAVRGGCEILVMADIVVLCHLTPKFIEIDVFLRRRGFILCFMFLDQGVDDVGACTHVSLILRGKLFVLPNLDPRLSGQCQSLGGHLDGV